MAKLQTLMASLEKSEAKVEKCKATIERHFKQLAKKIEIVEKAGYKVDLTNVDFNSRSAEFTKQIAHIEAQKWGADQKSVNEYWELCEVCTKLDDIRLAHRKLADAEQINNNWKVKIVAEKARVDIATAAPKVIVDFVNAWGELAFEWMMENTKNPDATSIKKHIENDKQIKIIQLTMRVMDVVGTITDAKHLEIGEKGDLVGIIEGEQGRASVETISAGGYNIQCWHYRTLVHKL